MSNKGMWVIGGLLAAAGAVFALTRKGKAESKPEWKPIPPSGTSGSGEITDDKIVSLPPKGTADVVMTTSPDLNTVQFNVVFNDGSSSVTTVEMGKYTIPLKMNAENEAIRTGQTILKEGALQVIVLPELPRSMGFARAYYTDKGVIMAVQSFDPLYNSGTWGRFFYKDVSGATLSTAILKRSAIIKPIADGKAMPPEQSEMDWLVAQQVSDRAMSRELEGNAGGIY